MTNKSKDGKMFILDSTAFYAGIPNSGFLNYHTTPLVIDEVSHGVMADIVKTLIDSSRLKVVEPSHRYLERAKKAARETGDIGNASETDLSVVALGLEMKDQGYDVTIVSDDYPVENLTDVLDMHFTPVLTRGISKTTHWFIYCIGCGKVFKEAGTMECDVCGTNLKKRFRAPNTSSRRIFKS